MRAGSPRHDRDLVGAGLAGLTVAGVPFPVEAASHTISTMSASETAREQTGGTPLQPALVAIVGKSDSGKTTFIEKLLPELIALGLRVGTVKHHAHAAEIYRLAGPDRRDEGGEEPAQELEIAPQQGLDAEDEIPLVDAGPAAAAGVQDAGADWRSCRGYHDGSLPAAADQTPGARHWRRAVSLSGSG